jgi:hypothetical protein
MLRQLLSARFTRSSAKPGGLVAACALAAVGMSTPTIADVTSNQNIQLELRPRICTLAANDQRCETRVSAKWLSDHEESLCLVILDRPEIKQCWENYSHGTYSIELAFVDDLVFQLRDPQLRQVLASETLRVIHEALHYRHRRRQPWNIFD